MANPFKPAKHKTSTEEALLLIKQARKAGLSVPDEQIRCAEGGEVCGLAPCHICRKVLQFEAADALYHRYDTSAGMQWITITPAYGRVELSAWRKFDLEKFVEMVRRQLRETLPPGTEVYGAIDVSANTRNNGDHHLQFHVHAFVYPALDKAAQKRVRKRFKRSRKTISKPVVFHWVPPEEIGDTADYTWKWFYRNRSSMEPVHGADGKLVHRKARKPKMRRAADRVVVHAILKKLKVTDLLFMVGIKPKSMADPFDVEIMSATRAHNND